MHTQQSHHITQGNDSNATTSLKETTAQPDSANTFVLLLSSHLKLHSAVLMPAAAVARQAAACPTTQIAARQDQQHSAACCYAPAAAIEAAVDWSSWTAAVPLMAQLVWRRQQHCWLLQHWKVALLADPCPCPAETRLHCVSRCMLAHSLCHNCQKYLSILLEFNQKQRIFDEHMSI